KLVTGVQTCALPIYGKFNKCRGCVREDGNRTKDTGSRIQHTSLWAGSGNHLDCRHERHRIRSERHPASYCAQSVLELGIQHMDCASLHRDHWSCRAHHCDVDRSSALVSKSMRDWQCRSDTDVSDDTLVIVFYSRLGTEPRWFS